MVSHSSLRANDQALTAPVNWTPYKSERRSCCHILGRKRIASMAACRQLDLLVGMPKKMESSWFIFWLSVKRCCDGSASASRLAISALRCSVRRLVSLRSIKARSRIHRSNSRLHRRTVSIKNTIKKTPMQVPANCASVLTCHDEVRMQVLIVCQLPSICIEQAADSDPPPMSIPDIPCIPEWELMMWWWSEAVARLDTVGELVLKRNTFLGTGGSSRRKVGQMMRRVYGLAWNSSRLVLLCSAQQRGACSRCRQSSFGHF